MISVTEPTADCQREIVRALVNIAEGRGTRAGTLIEHELHEDLTEYQWDRCWWNARWWARNEDRTTYELFRLAGKGCPVVVDRDGSRLAVDARYPDLVRASIERPSEPTRVESLEARREQLRPQRNPDAGQPLRVRAIRFEQNERVFYSAVVPAGDILSRSKVDEWSADVSEEEAGYQRAPMGTRLRAVANYMEEPEAVMPVGGLLNARASVDGSYGKVLEFEADQGQVGPIQSGWMTIPSEATPLYIVDMQHRLLGIKRAIEEDGREELSDFPMVLTIADGLSKLEEIEQFELINTTQKKVRTDLARRLMSIQLSDPDTALKYDQKGRKWEARGPKIADWLRLNSPVWRDAIMPPNKTKRDMPTALTKETSFVTSMKPILQTPVFQRSEDEHVATFIDRYWQAIAEIWPHAFQEPQANVIHQTAGVYSLHMLMPEIVELVRERHGMDLKAVLTKANFVEAMQPWRNELPADFWAKAAEDGAAQYGTGMGAFTRLAAMLRSKLETFD
jgi:DGQHR domain-containing protein